MCPFFHHRTDIPQWLAAQIGRVAAEWSDSEWQLEAIRLLLAVHIKHGRIVTTGMNMKSRLTTATNLVQAYLLEEIVEVGLYDDFADIDRRIKNATKIATRLFTVCGPLPKVTGISCGRDSKEPSMVSGSR
jgi:hypothetical protein